MAADEQPPANVEDGFVVRHIAIVDLPVEETYVVGLAEHEDGSGQNLIFQLAYAYDEQDVSLGMDTYCVTNEMTAVVYGGVTACVLEGGHLLLRFTPEAAAELDLPEECRLRLAANQQSIEQLRQGLRRVFTGQREMPDPLTL